MLYVILLSAFIFETNGLSSDEILHDTPAYTYYPTLNQLHAVPAQGTLDLQNLKHECGDVNFNNIFSMIMERDSIRKILLQGNQIDDSDIIDISSNLINFPELNTLNIDDNKITFYGLNILLIKALKHKELENIYFRENNYYRGYESFVNTCHFVREKKSLTVYLSEEKIVKELYNDNLGNALKIKFAV